MKNRNLKDLLFEQVARIGKALASPKRLELIELLAQGEKSVELLASQAQIDVRLASAHLKALRDARLVQTRRDGKYVYYRLSGVDVPSLWVALREAAQAHLLELRMALVQMTAHPDSLVSESRESLMDKARHGEVVVIDVRPSIEFDAGHLPFARSLPLDELEARLTELPTDRMIVAYCRGPFCVMSEAAVQLLRARGLHAAKMTDGVSEWAVHGLPLESSPIERDARPV